MRKPYIGHSEKKQKNRKNNGGQSKNRKNKKILFFPVGPLNAAQTIHFAIGWYGVVWYGMVWYGMVYGMVWYGMVWYQSGPPATYLKRRANDTLAI